MPNTAAWDNRITDYDPAVPLDQLLAHPMNPKIHPRAQTDALKGILGEVGWLTGVIVNRTSNRVLDGHDRIKAAMEAGQTTAPVFYVRVPEDQEPYILATFDPVGTLAATDSTVLADLLQEVATEDSAVQALLDRIAGAPALDPADLWQGMPEFEQDDIQGYLVHIHCVTAEDQERLLAQLGLPYTKKGGAISLWWPERPENTKSQNARGFRYSSES